MDISPVEQYFELALDLTERKRNKLLRQLDKEQPDVATELRRLLNNSNKNDHFACHSGTTTERKLDSLHHVAVQVRQIGEAVAWYRSKFTFDIEYQDETWAMLRFANLRIALVLPEQHPPHVALESDEAAVFGALKTHRDGTRSTYVSDPFGNAIELMDRSSLP